jgi:hypothetical protein
VSLRAAGNCSLWPVLACRIYGQIHGWSVARTLFRQFQKTHSSEDHQGAVEKLGSVLTDAEAGPLGVPEEDHPAIGQDIRHPDEVPLSPITGIESLLDLPQTVGVLVQHQLLSVVAPVALFGHKPFPFPCPSARSIRPAGSGSRPRRRLNVPYSPSYLEVAHSANFAGTEFSEARSHLGMRRAHSAIPSGSGN